MKPLATKKEYVQPTSKGQITIPAAFRRQLAINPSTLLEATLSGNQVVFTPVAVSKPRAESWEPVVDFTEFNQTGIGISDLQKRLTRWIKSTKPSTS